MTDKTEYFGTPESRDRDARLVGHEVKDNLIGRLREKEPDGRSIAGWHTEPVNPDGEEAADRIESLLAERDALKAEVSEARRRRDAWKAKAEDYDTIRAALRKKVGAPWPPSLSRAMWAALAADEKKRADDAEAENQRLREELGQHDGDLDERMAALGMLPMNKLLSEPPTPFAVHAGMNSIEFFAEWVARKHAEYLRMRMRYEVGKRPQDDELFEWVLAHAAAFAEVHHNLRAALKGDSHD